MVTARFARRYRWANFHRHRPSLSTRAHDLAGREYVQVRFRVRDCGREMIEFGKQCVVSTEWGNEVPLTLVRAYERLYDYTWNAEGRTNYWTRPEVWKNTQLACDKYLRTDIHGPNHARHKYIWVARRCEQWSFIQEQLPLLTSTNYDYFGGRAAFEEMAQTAARKTKKAP